MTFVLAFQEGEILPTVLSGFWSLPPFKKSEHLAVFSMPEWILKALSWSQNTLPNCLHGYHCDSVVPSKLSNLWAEIFSHSSDLVWLDFQSILLDIIVSLNISLYGCRCPREVLNGQRQSRYWRILMNCWIQKSYIELLELLKSDCMPAVSWSGVTCDLNGVSSGMLVIRWAICGCLLICIMLWSPLIGSYSSILNPHYIDCIVQFFLRILVITIIMIKAIIAKLVIIIKITEIIMISSDIDFGE